MKKVFGSVITAIIVISLIILSFRFGGISFTETQSETFRILIRVCLCSIIYCFITGEITRNYSQMDKLWSLLPIAYVWIIAARGGMKIRLVVFALIVTVWGIRLTVNFARKGAYRLRFWEGNEDYRWSIVKSSPFFKREIRWSLFDLLFISSYQNLLVMATCLPALACMESQAALGPADLLAAVLSLSFLALETVADEYQWKFQEKKKSMLSEGRALEELPMPYCLGFNTLGPWAYMRHPNYLGEQGVWVSLYIFAIGAGVTTYNIFNWSITGSMLLILLFMGSSALGEAITSGKYPRYKEYMQQVHKYLPLRKYEPDPRA